MVGDVPNLVHEADAAGILLQLVGVISMRLDVPVDPFDADTGSPMCASFDLSGSEIEFAQLRNACAAWRESGYSLSAFLPTLRYEPGATKMAVQLVHLHHRSRALNPAPSAGWSFQQARPGT